MNERSSQCLSVFKMADEPERVEVVTEGVTAVLGENTKPIFQVHNFSEQIYDQNVHFHLLKMVDSLFLWIGVKPEMSTLSVAATTKFDSIPAVVNLLGSSGDLTSSTLAQKLAKTTGKQCFVSCSVPASENNMLMTHVEARIIKERKQHPEKF